VLDILHDRAPGGSVAPVTPLALTLDCTLARARRSGTFLQEGADLGDEPFVLGEQRRQVAAVDED
jgi:hypothetical protein